MNSFFSDMTLLKKLFGGFGIIIVFLIGIGIFTHFGIGSIVENGRLVIQGKGLDSELAQREVDHLNWVAKVSGFLLDERIAELKVEVDPGKCGFGKWYYGEGRRQAEQLAPNLVSILKRIEKPHQELHESAVAIQRAAVSHEGRQGAKAIFTEQTKPALANVQELLHEVRDEGKKSIISDEAMLSAASTTQSSVALVVLVTVAFAILVAYFISVSITVPIRRAVVMLSELSKGHLDKRLRMARKDEIGQMAKAMDDFADNLQGNFVVALEKIADGNFAFEAKQVDDKDAIGIAMQKTLADMNSTLGQIYLAGEQVNSAAAQVSSASQSLSQGATETASSLEQITSSMTEMGSQTKLNAGNATQANQLAGQARDVAQKGNLQMKEMVGAMTDISESAQNISKIIKVIDEIAFQTNLLALNAAVEAARAGRHGKGFAVVAEEGRNLAARSAKAAGETAELIEGSVRKTAKGTEIADKTAEALAEIVSSVGKVTDLVSEIAAASNEQAQGITQVNQGLGQIDQVTQQNTASAEECAAAAEELSSQAAQLRQMLTHFQLKMETRGPTYERAALAR